MRRLATLVVVVLAATMALVGSASAESAGGLDNVMKSLRTAILAPVEWDGIWDTVDSVYTCAGVFQSTSPGVDTICGGKDYSQSPPQSDIVLTCTGTADATTIDVTCTGSGLIPSTTCTGDFSVVTHATRTGTAFFMVSIVNITVTGGGLGCDAFPPICVQLNSHGLYREPAPTAYCASPAKRPTWGQIRTRYR